MFERILHPTDFSPVAMAAFEHAVVLARRFGAKLTVMHAVTHHSSDPYAESIGVELLKEAYEAIDKETEKTLAGLVERAGGGTQAKCLVL